MSWMIFYLIICTRNFLIFSFDGMKKKWLTVRQTCVIISISTYIFYVELATNQIKMAIQFEKKYQNDIELCKNAISYSIFIGI